MSTAAPPTDRRERTPTARPDDEQPAMDPRLRARRIEVKRQSGRRRLRWVVVVGVLLALVLAAAGALVSPVLDVDRVQVVGVYRTTPEQVREAAGVEAGAPLAGVDEAGAAAGVAALPWVAEADVRRRWPGTVVVEVRERVPAAVVTTASGGTAVVDGTGWVVEVREAAAEPAGLPALEGVVAPDEVGRRLGTEADAVLAAAAAVPEGLADRLEVLRVGDGGPEAVLAGGAVVHLPPGDGLDEGYVALASVLAAVDAACVATVDVRVPDAPVLTRSC